jgi:hypothetical protein
MRIKIIGENNCARATRHLLRLAGFAVTDFLPADAVVQGPAAGYAITIDLFSDCVSDRRSDRASDLSPAKLSPNSHLGPDRPTQEQMSSASESAVADNSVTAGSPSSSANENTGAKFAGYIHFDSVDSALETAVLRHVAQLAAGPVIVDRPGGVVRSERELRIVAPSSGDARADEAAAVAIEFGILRGLLDLVAPDARGDMRWNGAGKKLLSGDGGTAAVQSETNTGATRARKKTWWPFAVVLFFAALGVWSAARTNVAEASGFSRTGFSLSAFDFLPLQQEILRAGVGDFGVEGHGLKPVLREPASTTLNVVDGVTKSDRLKPVLLKAGLLTRGVADRVTESRRLKPALLAAQGQFATGAGVKITDGVNVLVVDPCQGQSKIYASINQTGNTQLVSGTAARKIYVCSIHVVVAAATDVAVVEGTGSVCATGTAGVSGFGGATAATGWNFAGNGGIALGSGESSLGAEGTSGDNLCVFNSGSGQVSGGMSYVVE